MLKKVFEKIFVPKIAVNDANFRRKCALYYDDLCM
ncbi:MAG: hypothetical protein CFH41_00561 [Alphaproteobacteria bacterium MarineAlpha11_Bin1]|nr:MAG: hypothetical protein CFH41_00561 [Alphaproteobacteria bacterium MarineAlpha11_Bin1]